MPSNLAGEGYIGPYALHTRPPAGRRHGVGGGECLQALEDAEDFRNLAADFVGVDGVVADDAVGVEEEGRAAGHALGREDAVGTGDLAALVGDEGVGDLSGAGGNFVEDFMGENAVGADGKDVGAGGEKVWYRAATAASSVGQTKLKSEP